MDVDAEEREAGISFGTIRDIWRGGEPAAGLLHTSLRRPRQVCINSLCELDLAASRHV